MFPPKCLRNLYPLLGEHQSNSERNSLYRDYVLWNKQLRADPKISSVHHMSMKIIFPLQVY